MSGPATSVASVYAKREANRVIRDDIDLHDGEPVAFFCECADRYCYAPVWLTAAEFDRASSDPDWHALKAGHVVAQPAAAP